MFSVLAGLTIFDQVSACFAFVTDRLTSWEGQGHEFLKKFENRIYISGMPIVCLTERQRQYVVEYGNVVRLSNWLSSPAEELQESRSCPVPGPVELHNPRPAGTPGSRRWESRQESIAASPPWCR